MSQTCQCCTPDTPLTPTSLDNRPGLSAIAYRIGTYAGFRETMLAAIAAFPELSQLTTRQSGDYSITFIELWAALLDVLTFYQERYANEVFLRTARQPESLRRLARLLDYRPRPGVAALANLAFSIDPGKSVSIPVGLRVQSVPSDNQQPQTYETLEGLFADARFNRLRIFPGPTAINPLAATSTAAILDPMTGPGFLSALSANDAVVLFNDGGSDPIEEKKIASLSVTEDRVVLTWTKPVSGGNWNADSKAFQFRRTLRLFGHNAPTTFMQPTTSTAVPGGILWSQVQTDFTNPGGSTLNLDARYSDIATGTQLLVVTAVPPLHIPPIEIGLGSIFQSGLPPLSKSVFPVETQLKVGLQTSVASGISGISDKIFGGDIGTVLPGIIGHVIAHEGVRTNLVTVTRVSQVPAVITGADSPAGSPGAMNDTVTQVTVTPPLASIADIRKALVLELVGDPISFWNYCYEDSITDSTVYLPGRLVQLDGGMGVEVGRAIQQNAFVPGSVIQPSVIDPGRRVLLTDSSGQVFSGSVQATPGIDPPDGAAGSFGYLVLPLQVDGLSLASGSAVLLGNVALSSNGQTVNGEVVGNGNAAAKFQSFTLQKQPLTYVPGSGPGGVSSSLELRVNQLKWTEVPELYGQPPDAQVFSTRSTDDGKTLIQGGDAGFGAVFPTGQANIVAKYRYGAGVGGRVGANTLTTLLDRIQGLSGVTNPLAAEGGADPETSSAIRRNAPRTVRTFDRAVSLMDFEDLITASGEVAKASANWVWDGFEPAVHVTVAGQDGGIFSDPMSLGAALANSRDPNHRLLIDNYIRVPILLSASLWIDPARSRPDVLAEAVREMRNALSFDLLNLGESLHVSRIYLILQNVPGVVGADVTRFGFKEPAGVADFQAYQDARGVTRLTDGSVAPVQDFLRIFPARPNSSRPGKVSPAELAWIESPSTDIAIAAQG